jgi:hypothetical protein
MANAIEHGDGDAALNIDRIRSVVRRILFLGALYFVQGLPAKILWIEDQWREEAGHSGRRTHGIAKRHLGLWDRAVPIVVHKLVRR